MLFEDSTQVGITHDEKLRPEGFTLSQNYPNPFNPLTNVNYYLPKAGAVELTVYDINGRMVKQIKDEYENAGSHQVVFNGNRLSSGFYFLKLKFNGQDISSIRMTLIK